MQNIKTIIKYQKGTEGINNGNLFGFVTKENGHWRGCRDTDTCKKKIVLVSPAISDSIQEGIPYSASIVPMRSDNGFVTISATPIKYKARVVTQVRKGEYVVYVKFGMKTFTYDPTSKSEKYTDIGKIADCIRHRMDLHDAQQVAEDFIDSACIVKDLYNRGRCSSTQ